jgi:hypothetical protein
MGDSSNAVNRFNAKTKKAAVFTAALNGNKPFI